MTVHMTVPSALMSEMSEYEKVRADNMKEKDWMLKAIGGGC